jgi:hypothetical protein
LPSAIGSFGDADPNALSQFGKQFGDQFDDLQLALDGDEDDPVEVARRSAAKPEPTKPTQAKAKPAKPAKPEPEQEPDRPNLEPIGDEAHKHRRIPTQPPAALQLQLDDDTRPTKQPPSQQQAQTQQGAGALPPPPKLAPRQSPAPAQRGLFSTDRITNLLAGAALGLLVMIYPARQIARGFQTREVEPQIAELQGAIDHPLGVQAGLVEKPEAIAARIHDGRRQTRTRYLAIWMLVGLPIGLGVGFIRR